MLKCCQSRRNKNALLKLPLRSERATGALAIVNHYTSRFYSLSDGLEWVLVGEILGKYNFPCNYRYSNEVENSTHVWRVEKGILNTQTELVHLFLIPLYSEMSKCFKTTKCCKNLEFYWILCKSQVAVPSVHY